VPVLSHGHDIRRGSLGGGDECEPRTFATRAVGIRKRRIATIFRRVTDDRSASAAASP